jgi:entericidin B
VKRIWLSIIVLLAAVSTATALSACNTVRGVGQDIERGGKAIQKAAR